MAEDSEMANGTVPASSTHAELTNDASNTTITADGGERAAKRIKMDEPALSSESGPLAPSVSEEGAVKPTNGEVAQAPREETRKGLAPIKKE